MKAKLAALTGLAACGVVGSAATAFAHPHHELLPGGGLLAGAAHPLLGVDHLLAMVAVGLLGARLAGRAKWAVPGAFLLSMVLGGAVGMAGWSLPGVEFGIAGSLVALGVALSRREPFAAAATAVAAALFGFLHGQAHGVEMPTLANPAVYALGFVAVTACLHVAGVGVGAWAMQSERRGALVRWSGAAVAVVGLFFAVAM